MDVPEVFHDRIKFLADHAYYVIVPEVSHDRTVSVPIHVYPKLSQYRTTFDVIHVYVYYVAFL